MWSANNELSKGKCRGPARHLIGTCHLLHPATFTSLALTFSSIWSIVGKGAFIFLEMPQKIWESEGSSKQLLHSVSAGGALLVVVEFWKILKAALHQNVIYASLFSQEKRFCSLLCCHSGQVCNIKFSVCYEASEASDKVVALWSFSKHKATT